jgi:2,3-bisphosphoglycerate-dependent phosphoglycerate mutase
MNTVEITFLRHGRSRADDEQVYEGHYDSPLTDMGRAQARARAAAWLAEQRTFDLIIHSTMVRAKETAEIIAAALHAPLEADPDWMEMDHGKLAGLTFEEANRLYPRPAFRNRYEQICQTGESEWDVHIRAGGAVQAVVRRGPGKYLVVAHGGIINAAVRAIIGAPLPLNGSEFWIAFHDTGYITFRFKPESQQWILIDFIPGVDA